MDTFTRWTGISALVVSSFSLGMSGWMVGCHGKSAPARGESPSTEAQKPIAVQTALPIAAVAASAQPAAAQTAPDRPQDSSAKADAKPAKSAPKHAASPGALRVKRLVVTRKVESREPLNPATSFPMDGTPLYAFVELENKTDDDAQIVVTFEKPGTSAGHVELGVPANQARWRTWGMTRGVRDIGAWEVVVRSATGTELARAPFEMTRGT